jgi:hypothetical protein
MVDIEPKALEVREHPKPDLVINKVPGDIARKFKELADEEFDGHYGFCLRELMIAYTENKLLKKILDGRKPV